MTARRTDRMTAALGSRAQLDTEPAGQAAIRTKPIRVTVDLDPALYRRIKGYAEAIAVDLDVPSLPLTKLFRAMAEAMVVDTAVFDGIVAVVRRNSVGQ